MLLVWVRGIFLTILALKRKNKKKVLICFAAEKRKTGYRLFPVPVLYEPHNLPCVTFVK